MTEWKNLEKATGANVQKHEIAVWISLDSLCGSPWILSKGSLRMRNPCL